MSATLQSHSFNEEQRTEFADSYISGLVGGRPSNDICVVFGRPSCHAGTPADIDNAAMSAIHGLIEA
jgi:hypothetical protein